MKIGWALVALATLCGSKANASTPQDGLTLQEALNLPPAVLAERVLGQVGQYYPEVERPNLGGVPGRVGFGLEFASAPHSAGFPGLCQADILSVAFWPASPESSPDGPMHVHGTYNSTRYKLVDDTAPPTTWSDAYERHLTSLCERSGPVFGGVPGEAPSSHYFGGRFAQSGEFWPAHAYFAVRALQKAIATARSATPAEIGCHGETAAMTASLCANPRHWLADLNLARLSGFSISPCEEGAPQLCVEAGLGASDDPNSHLVITIRMRTDVARVDGGTPPEFNLLSVQIEESSFVN